MNAPDFDNPLITRYALDDLPSAERDAASEWIESQPDLQHEVAEIQALAETLRATSPLHDLHLSTSQRRRVLQPPARKPLPAAPRLVATRSHAPTSFVSSLLRIAALIAFALTAFWMGRETRPTSSSSLASSTPPDSPVTLDSSTPTASHLIAADLPPAPKAVAQTPVVEPAVLSAAPAPAPAPAAPRSNPVPTVAKDKPAARMAFPKIPAFGLATTKANAPFINASRTAADLLPLHPRQLRQPIANSGAQLAAKPIDPAQTKVEEPARKKPELFLHSWNVEVAACPWDPQLRLLRVDLQFPADQEAVQIGDSNYPLEVTFDPNNVRQFRRLGTRHVPSPELRSAGHQVVWYEFRPNGSPASAHETGKHIATVRLPSARFTTQAVGPFDASRLQVIDRGQGWQQARDDFRFETAMLGLGLLLDGGLPGSDLNHQLLLEVAETAQGSDPEGNRARLVQALRQLAHLTGR